MDVMESWKLWDDVYCGVIVIMNVLGSWRSYDHEDHRVMEVFMTYD